MRVNLKGRVQVRVRVKTILSDVRVRANLKGRARVSSLGGAVVNTVGYGGQSVRYYGDLNCILLVLCEQHSYMLRLWADSTIVC